MEPRQERPETTVTATHTPSALEELITLSLAEVTGKSPTNEPVAKKQMKILPSQSHAFFAHIEPVANGKVRLLIEASSPNRDKKLISSPNRVEFTGESMTSLCKHLAARAVEQCDSNSFVFERAETIIDALNTFRTRHGLPALDRAEILAEQTQPPGRT